MPVVVIEMPQRRSDGTPVLLAYPFRPFFLLAGVYGALLMAAWVALLTAGLPLPLANPVAWHGHEMLFGLVPTAIAGFLLTAMCNWTGARPLRGRGLLALIGVWLLGRVALWSSGWLPAPLVMALDLAFLPALAGYAGWVMWRRGHRKSLHLAGVLGLLALANLASHLGMAGWWPAGLRLGEVLALDLIAVLMVVIGGRITPSFTATWLRLNGRDPGAVRTSVPLDRAAALSVLALVPAELATGTPWLVAGLSLLAAGLNGWRLLRWRGWHAAGEPLLWVLHLGLAWVVLALVLKGLAPPLGLPASAWMHALGAGAMGTLILGVMTRVALGHTGRSLVLPRGGIVIYLAVILAGLLRLAVALQFGVAGSEAVLAAAGLAWVLAFGLFTVLYWPVLTRPRVDGRPG
jgi:uncharacterized protein involved in response to NO